MDEAFQNFKGEDVADVSTDDLLRDIDGNGKAKAADEAFQEMKPEFCLRKIRVFSSSGGCSNRADSCFQFSAGSFESEQSRPPAVEEPENILPVNVKLVQQTAETKGVHAAGGYLKSSKGTWGICLPEKAPQAHLDKMQTMATKLKGMLEEESGNSDEIASLLQRAQTGEMFETEYIGWLLIIPAIVGMAALFLVALFVLIPFAVAQLLVGMASSILLIFGKVGRFLRWLVFLPLCLLGAAVSIAFGIIFVALFLVYGLGVLLVPNHEIGTFENKKKKANEVAEHCTLTWHLEKAGNYPN